MRIGIIGAGLAGLAAAVLLSRKGHGVTVMERVPILKPMGAGLLLQPPGIRILEEIGGLTDILPGAARITALRGKTAGGRSILSLDYSAIGPDVCGLGIRRPVIWSSLLESANRAGADIMTSCPVDGLTSGENTAKVSFAAGGQREFDFVVVAAGTHCSLWGDRSHRVSRPYPWGCLWATVSLPEGWDLNTLQQRCAGTGAMAGILPTGNLNGAETAAFYWSVKNDSVAEWRAKPMSDWQRRIEAVWPEVAAMAGGLAREDVEHAVYRDVWSDPPHAGRVVVIGDAAHGTSPQLGSGHYAGIP